MYFAHKFYDITLNCTGPQRSNLKFCFMFSICLCFAILNQSVYSSRPKKRQRLEEVPVEQPSQDQPSQDLEEARSKEVTRYCFIVFFLLCRASVFQNAAVQQILICVLCVQVAHNLGGHQEKEKREKRGCTTYQAGQRRSLGTDQKLHHPEDKESPPTAMQFQ